MTILLDRLYVLGDRTALDTVLVVGDDIAKYAKEV